MHFIAFLWIVICFIGCKTARPLIVPSVFLENSGESPILLNQAVTKSRLTVLVFFSPTCPCQRAHDARLIELYNLYHRLGVQFWGVASEVGLFQDDLIREQHERGYPFPILLDTGATLANAVHAEYATHSLVISPEGKILYQGGIDSDRSHLSSDATSFLAKAIEDGLAGRPIRIPQAKTLGCVLRLP
ncbi:redoxin family protein [Pajaroellobacter abortibovis]|uniref:Thioredoxin domain-containing protein n=1 Tax=Pajaroellobacter abortibovis TaxID=1882918 RepID=A0A1L6MZ02_9BACT|nr:redoxin family protein [Pajaroellobacter abortibovis]APS00720.1 hypothetical protein BCY86_08540 [Pajaroellobacter abortibovis]